MLGIPEVTAVIKASDVAATGIAGNNLDHQLNNKDASAVAGLRTLAEVSLVK